MPPDPTLHITTKADTQLVIPSARRLAEVFFELDPSSRQPPAPESTTSYDDWSEQTERNRIEPYDVTVLNTSMRARTKPEVWHPLHDAGNLNWLEAVDPDWDLLSMPQDEFDQRNMGAVVEQLAFSMLRKWINVSVATKMLHLKRPRLMPVLDPLVVAQLGARISTTAKFETRAKQIREVVLFVREQGLANGNELTAIKAHLASRGKERTLVRVLDALLWSSHPASLIYPAMALVERWDAEDQPGAG